MARGEIYMGVDTLNLQLITPFGREYRKRRTEFSREERTASKRLVRDITAVKHELTLSYSLIGSKDLSVFQTLYETFGELVIRVFSSDLEFEDFTVLMDPIEQERVLLYDEGSGEELWGGVEIRLLEV